MAQPVLRLPSELWNHVFGFLSPADKFSVRASCKHFKRLADHRSLWRDWAVVLGFRNGSYNCQFWATLRRRRVASAVLRGAKEKDWKRVAKCLPSLTTVVMEQSTHASLQHMKDFPNLQRLAIRSSRAHLLLPLDVSSGSLTQLSLCDVTLQSTGLDGFICALSQFTQLTSLVCHQVGIFEDTIWMLHSILNCLPKLEHLSLSVVQMCEFHHMSRPNPGPLGGAGAPVLSSLELIDCIDGSLPEDVMRLIPGLKTLAVFYRCSHHEISGRHPLPDGHHLRAWLRDLPRLSTLIVVKGPPVKKYVAYIPATVTHLTLCVAGLSSEVMAAVAVQVPNLLHLHIDPWPSHLGARTARIPQLFPKLKSLKLRHEHVPERDFLQLHQMQDLEYLEILDSCPRLPKLAGELRALTNYRLQVTTSPRRRDVLACPCVPRVYYCL